MKEIKLKQPMPISKFKIETGFTLVELLISISFMSFLLVLTLPVWQLLNHQSQIERYSVYQFFHVVTDEVQQNQVMNGPKYELNLKTSGNDEITLSRYHEIVRRRVNRTGHEVLLRDVSHFEISYSEHYITLILIMKSGNHYEKNITKFNW